MMTVAELFELAFQDALLMKQGKHPIFRSPEMRSHSWCVKYRNDLWTPEQRDRFEKEFGSSA